MNRLAGFAVAACAAAWTAPAAAASAYTYAGVASAARVAGAAATIVALRTPEVATGHVAAWVGVSGSDAWVQAGIAVPGPRGRMVLYEEIRRPGDYRFVVLGPARAGTAYRVAVRRLGGRSAWRVLVDGRRRGRDAVLPAGTGALQAQVVAENWVRRPGACNAFRFRFGAVAIGRRSAFRQGVALRRTRGGYVASGYC